MLVELYPQEERLNNGEDETGTKDAALFQELYTVSVDLQEAFWESNPLHLQTNG